MLPGSVDEESDVQMSSICPLDDELLPVAADGLRLKQVWFPPSVLQCLGILGPPLPVALQIRGKILAIGTLRTQNTLCVFKPLSAKVSVGHYVC